MSETIKEMLQIKFVFIGEVFFVAHYICDKKNERPNDSLVAEMRLL